MKSSGEMIKSLFSYTDGSCISNDFLNLARKQKKLTFDERFLNPDFSDDLVLPFKEIWWHIDEAIGDLPLYSGSYDDFINDLIKAFEEVIKKIDPNEKYLFLHSSGTDSRIISGIMLKLKREGFSDFDNVHFRVWGSSEAESFLKLMKIGGWSNYSVIDDNVPDPYDIGNPDISTGGWVSYTTQINFWQDYDSKETIFMGGAGGAVLEKSFQKWYYGRPYFSNRGITLNETMHRFKGVFFPMLEEKVFNFAMSMPLDWKGISDSRLGRDKVRTDIVEKLGMMDAPVQGRGINFNVSDKRKAKMKELYYNSSFYQRYKVEADFFPEKSKQLVYGFGPKLWGFAVTVYEKTKNHASPEVIKKPVTYRRIKKEKRGKTKRNIVKTNIHKKTDINKLKRRIKPKLKRFIRISRKKGIIVAIKKTTGFFIKKFL